MTGNPLRKDISIRNMSKFLASSPIILGVPNLFISFRQVIDKLPLTMPAAVLFSVNMITLVANRVWAN